MIAATLTITLVQSELVWHEPAINRGRFAERLAPLAGRSDLIVLPETFTSGFTMAADAVAEPPDGPTLEWLQRTAERLSAAVTGSYLVREAGATYNRLVWARPDGSYETYDKRHLFRMAGEHRHVAAGARKLIVELHGWRICPLVCYDLRFPVWSRNRIGTAEEYDILLYVANWPAPRRRAWKTLLEARAIENLCYCAGVNRVGSDARDNEYAGDSAVHDWLGNLLTEPVTGEAMITAVLERAPLEAYRARFAAHLDADVFRIES